MNSIKESPFYKITTFNDKFTLIFTFLSNLFIHFFIYTNPLFVYDAVRIFDESTGIENGRLVISPLFALFDGFQNPWLFGLLFSVLMAFSVNTIRYILDINKILHIILLSLLTVSYPVIFYTQYFSNSIIIYAMALLFSSLSVIFLSKKKIKYYVLSAICIIFSLLCYQAYLPFAVCLFLAYIIKLTTTENESKDIIKLFFIGTVIFVLSTLIYYGFWKIAVIFSPIDAQSYRGESNVAINLFNKPFEKIIFAYYYGLQQSIANIFYSGNLKTICYIAFAGINILSIVLLFVIQCKNKNIFNKTLTFIICLGMPLAIGLIYIFSPYIPHKLMKFPAIIWSYIFIFCLENIKFKKKLFNKVLICLLSFLIFENIVLGNAGYIKSFSDTQRSLSYATRLVDRIERIDGVNHNTDIILVSDTEWFALDASLVDSEADNIDMNIGRESRTWKNKLSGFSIPSELNATPYLDSLIWYINDNCNYMGLNYSYKLTNDDVFRNSSIFDSLEKFPAENCTAWLNDSLIIYV